MALLLSLAVSGTFLNPGGLNLPSQTSKIDPSTGSTVELLSLPGDPEALSVVVINNVADVMIKTKDVVGAGGGAYSSAPPDVVAKYGSAGNYNYGYKLNTDPVTKSANCTVEYSDSATGADAVPNSINALCCGRFPNPLNFPDLYGDSAKSNTPAAVLM